ncbi:esterase [Serratia sp. S1B]|nr:esterase [Serratia sp. S1B]
MILNTVFLASTRPTNNAPVIILHGLFGSLSNLGMIARKIIQNHHNVIQIDLRNHGLSPHVATMDYELMAQDVIETLNYLEVKNFSLIGHSMGGKVSMKIAGLVPDRVERLVVLDVAPVVYIGERHDAMFAAIDAVTQQGQANLSRTQATEIMRKYLDNEMIIQFLLKSFVKGQWLYNVDAFKANYGNLVGWNPIQPWNKPCLFIRGGNSEYILPQYQAELEKQFPNADVQTVPDTGHWLHAEKPDVVFHLIQQYFTQETEVNV